MNKEKLIKILRNRALVRWRRFFPEKRPEHLLHHKLWSEMSLWEKRMYGGKDGKPVPVKSFMGGNQISHEECEKQLDRALKISLAERVRSYLDI